MGCRYEDRGIIVSDAGTGYIENRTKPSHSANCSPLRFVSELGVANEGGLLDSPEGFYVYRIAGQNQIYDSLDWLQAEIGFNLFRLRTALQWRVFGSDCLYYEMAGILPSMFSNCGFSQEITTKCNMMDGYVNAFPFEEARKALYIEDIFYLIDSFFETYNQAIDSLRSMFWRVGDINPIAAAVDGVCRITSPQSHAVLRELETFVVRMYSSLDILSRILYEIERIPECFSSIRSISFRGETLFASFRKKNKHSGEAGRIFKLIPEVVFLEDLRNEVVHNRFLDASGACYIRLESGKVKERFVLIPDADKKRADSQMEES